MMTPYLVVVSRVQPAINRQGEPSCEGSLGGALPMRSPGGALQTIFRQEGALPIAFARRRPPGTLEFFSCSPFLGSGLFTFSRFPFVTAPLFEGLYAPITGLLRALLKELLAKKHTCFSRARTATHSDTE
jgi:hypothetical protein